MTELLAVTQEYLQLSRAVLVVSVLMLLWTWESIWPVVIGRQTRARHAVRHLALATFNGLALFFTLSLATTLLAAWTAEHEFGLLYLLGIDWGWRFLLGFLILDLGAYLWHRASHWFAFLWRFHRLHHSDMDVDCTTSVRFHIGELSLAATTRLPVIILFGLEPLTIVVHETVLVAVSQFHHANISLGRWDRVLCWFIVTPAMHRIHHSRWKPETNSNYASVLSLWDRVCQSFHRPHPAAKIEQGLDEFLEPHWHTLSGMLKTPFAHDPPKNEEALPQPSPDHSTLNK